jgi:hypothetical protein
VAAPDVVVSTRYTRPEISDTYWLLAIANINAPTRAELNAGTNLANEIAANDGFTVEGTTLEAADQGHKFTAQVSHRINAADSSISCFASLNSVDVRGLIHRDDVGFLVFLDEGDVAGRKMDIYPVKCKSVSKPRDNEAVPLIVVSFAITATPAVDITIPA